jgi:hypothetical protein
MLLDTVTIDQVTQQVTAVRNQMFDGIGWVCAAYNGVVLLRYRHSADRFHAKHGWPGVGNQSVRVQSDSAV